MTTTTRGRPRSFDRDAALDRAIRLFWRQGYEATTVRHLTAELGIGAPSLYHAFGDKQQLFLEALGRYDQRYGGFIDAALAEEPTARQAAERVFAEAPARYTRDGLPPGCLVVSGEAGSADPAVTTHLRRLRAEKVRAFADKIRADVDSGTLPADTGPAALARYTMSVVNGIAQAARDGAGRDELEQAGRLALRAWP